MNNRSEFTSLIETACEAYRERPDSLHWEPHYCKILEFIKSNAKDRDYFVRQFIGFVENPKSELVPLIEFCMHELRWTEVLEMAKKQGDLVERSLANKWMNNIVEAFGDDWDGTLYYDYYSSE